MRLPILPMTLVFAFALPILGAEAKVAARTVLRVAALDQDPPLDKAAFKATLDGSPATVLRVRGPKDDMVLFLVLDLTGEVSLIDAARNALAERLPQLPPNIWLAVVKSQDLLQVLADPTPDRQKVLDTILTYAATGKAGLLATLETAARLGDGLIRRADVRVAMLYLTDSNIYNYREDFTNPVINSSDSRDLSRRFPEQLIREKMQKLSQSLSSSETPFFFVHLNYFSDPINEAYQRGLLQLAAESGGIGAFSRSPGEIPASLDKVLAAAASHWSIGLELGRVKSRTATVALVNGEREIPSHTRFSLGR